MSYPLDETEFAKLVREELDRARLFHNPINSLHEGYAVILEELDELWDEVRRKRRDREPMRQLRELVQVAAMCQRTAEDSLLVAPPEPVP